MQWLETHEGPLGYAALGLAAWIEYVFPPFPGDTISLAGVALTVRAGWSTLLVYLALNVGGLIGSSLAYWVGLKLSAPGRSRRLLDRWGLGPPLERLQTEFQRRDVIVLLLNRFIPSFRALVYVGAGFSRVPFWKVLIFGGISTLAWNAILFAVGYWLARSFDDLRTLVGRYTVVSLTIIGGLALASLAFHWRKRRRESNRG